MNRTLTVNVRACDAPRPCKTPFSRWQTRTKDIRERMAARREEYSKMNHEIMSNIQLDLKDIILRDIDEIKKKIESYSSKMSDSDSE